MTTLSWAIYATAALLLAYAVSVLASRAARSGGEPKSLGCAFACVSTIFWSLAFGFLLRDGWSGTRLGVGLALLVHSLAALTGPEGSAWLRASILLLLAVGFGGPVVPELLAAIDPPPVERAVRETEAKLEVLRDRHSAAQRHAVELAEDREIVRNRLRELEHASFEDLQADERAYTLLRELAEIERLARGAAEREQRVAEEIRQNESALRRLERMRDAGVRDREEVEAVLEDTRTEPGSLAPVTGDDYLEREELRALFEALSAASEPVRPG